MALDKQKILNELESVVNQLQGANCGCLSNVFNNQQVLKNQQQNMIGYNAPHNYGHNYHGSTCGHNPSGSVPVQGSCGEPCHNNQAHGNCTHTSNAARNHFDSAFVQPIVKDVYEELKTMTPENTVVNSSIANQMGLPIAQHPDIRPNPCNASNMPDIQKAMQNAKAMQAMGNQFMNAVNTNQNPVNNEIVGAQPNLPKLVPPPASYDVMQCQNCATAASAQMTNNNFGQVPNSNMMPANPQYVSQNQSPYGQHAQGMAKFQELFPGVMGNGDLSFDPMAVAIKMNPNNQQNVQMPVAQSNLNNPNQSNNGIHCAHLIAAPPQQLNSLQYPVARNINIPMTNPNIPSIGSTVSDVAKVQHQNSNNGLYPNEQQVCQISPRQHVTQDKVVADHGNPHRSFHPVSEKLMKEVLAGSVPTPNPGICEHAHTPVAPVSQTQPQERTIEYNTLGQPVEILPAEIYHKPEQSLPQTLSPQPNTSNNLSGSYVNNDYIVNNIASNKTCLMANPLTNGTHQNVNSSQKAENNFVERTVGDTAMNKNVLSPRPHADLHSGDKPDLEQPIAGSPKKLSPNSERKHRNGLQDIVYTSYPKSTKWSFHGNARKTSPPGQRPV